MFERMQLARRQLRQEARGWGLEPSQEQLVYSLQRGAKIQKTHCTSNPETPDENNEEGGGSGGSWAVLGVALGPEQADGAGSDPPAEQRGHSTLGFVVSSFCVLSQINSSQNRLDFGQKAEFHTELCIVLSDLTDKDLITVTFK